MSASSKCGRGRISKDMKESNEEIWCGAFPDDVVVEILSRLPPKPFFRFKCVSKTWLALSSHAFPLNRLLQPTLLGFFHESYPTSFSKFQVGLTNISGGVDEVDATLSALPYHDQHTIVDCCNGLLLVKCWNFVVQSNSPSYYLYVYNPATRKHIALESLPKVYSRAYYETISLAFDPQDQPRFHVVCFRHTHNDEDVCANIFLTFSSDSGRWQHGGNLECDLRIAHSTASTFVGGKVHRVTTRHEIVSIDPVDSSYLVTKFDFPGLLEKGVSEVGQSQGLLHFMFVNQFRKMSIWVPENGDRQNWILKHQLRLEETHVLLFDIFNLFCNIKLDPEKDVLFMHSGNGRIKSVHLKTGKSNGICVLAHRTCPPFWLYTPCFLV